MSGILINKNYERYNMWQDRDKYGIAYMAPQVREAFIRCEELNNAIIQFIGKLTTIDGTDLDTLYKQRPDILRTVVYDNDTYNKLLAMLGESQ